jgi:hypothetical protein
MLDEWKASEVTVARECLIERKIEIEKARGTYRKQEEGRKNDSKRSEISE